jgi:hypothetical protein
MKLAVNGGYTAATALREIDHVESRKRRRCMAKFFNRARDCFEWREHDFPADDRSVAVSERERQSHLLGR